jgi:serine/threonine protein kinase
MLDYFTHDHKDCLYLVFPFQPSTLWNVFVSEEVRQRQLPDSRLLKFMLGCFAGLAHLHGLGEGIVHADLSLKNVLVSVHNEALIADGGSAHAAMDVTLGSTAEITTQYVRSPERLLGGPTTMAADVWSLGVDLVCLYAGVCPWVVADVAAFQQLSLIDELLGDIVEAESLHPLPLWSAFMDEHSKGDATPPTLVSRTQRLQVPCR